MALTDIATGKDKRKVAFKDRADHPQKVGKDFEGQIRNTCEVYRQLGVAYIQQFFLPTLFIPPDKNKPPGPLNKGKIIYRKKTGFDFIGATIAPERNGIFIECKSTADGTISIDQDDSGIRIHQIDTMLWLEEHGFITMFLWKIRRSGTVYKIPPSKIREMAKGRKCFHLTDCDDSRIPIVLPCNYEGALYYDFLNVLEGTR